MAGAGFLSKLARRTRRANRAIDKALAPTPSQHLLSPGQQRVKKPTEAQAVTHNLGERAAALGTGRGRKQGAVTVGSLGLAGMALSEDEKPKPAAKKKSAAKPAAKKKPPPPKPKSKSPKPAVKNDRVNPSDYPIYNKDTKSGKAFRAAFKAAVKARKKTFKFEGRTYNTKKKK